MNETHHDLNELDRRLIAATQQGLPLDVDPWGALAVKVGATRAEVMSRLSAMLDAGVIRRIAAVPDHYRVGVTANGMTVWDVDDARVDQLGAQVGALDFVSHCYRRPRREGVARADQREALGRGPPIGLRPSGGGSGDRPPSMLWRYNLFAMVHGATRDEVHGKTGQIAALLGDAARAHEVLFSTRVLKKTGFRMTAATPER